MSRFFRNAFFRLRCRRDGNDRGARRARTNEKADVRGVHIMADVRFFYISFFSEVFPEAVTFGNISGKRKYFYGSYALCAKTIGFA